MYSSASDSSVHCMPFAQANAPPHTNIASIEPLVYCRQYHPPLEHTPSHDIRDWELFALYAVHVLHPTLHRRLYNTRTHCGQSCSAMAEWVMLEAGLAECRYDSLRSAKSFRFEHRLDNWIHHNSFPHVSAVSESHRCASTWDNKKQRFFLPSAVYFFYWQEEKRRRERHFLWRDFLEKQVAALSYPLHYSSKTFRWGRAQKTSQCQCSRGRQESPCRVNKIWRQKESTTQIDDVIDSTMTIDSHVVVFENFLQRESLASPARNVFLPPAPTCSQERFVDNICAYFWHDKVVTGNLSSPARMMSTDSSAVLKFYFEVQMYVLSRLEKHFFYFMYISYEHVYGWTWLYDFRLLSWQ